MKVYVLNRSYPYPRQLPHPLMVVLGREHTLSGEESLVCCFVTLTTPNVQPWACGSCWLPDGTRDLSARGLPWFSYVPHRERISFYLRIVSQKTLVLVSSF